MQEQADSLQQFPPIYLSETGQEYTNQYKQEVPFVQNQIAAETNMTYDAVENPILDPHNNYDAEGNPIQDANQYYSEHAGDYSIYDKSGATEYQPLGDSSSEDPQYLPQYTTQQETLFDTDQAYQEQQHTAANAEHFDQNTVDGQQYASSNDPNHYQEQIYADNTVQEQYVEPTQQPDNQYYEQQDPQTDDPYYGQQQPGEQYYSDEIQLPQPVENAQYNDYESGQSYQGDPTAVDYYATSENTVISSNDDQSQSAENYANASRVIEGTADPTDYLASEACDSSTLQSEIKSTSDNKATVVDKNESDFDFSTN